MAKYTLKRSPIQITSEIIGIPLTKGYIALVDVQDADLAQFNWQSRVDKHTIYAMRAIRGQSPIHLHQVILARVLRHDLLSDERVDHIDGNGLNNCRSNLRIATSTENSRNRRRRCDNTSGFKGVSWSREHQKWHTYIYFNGKSIHLGYFNTPQAAHQVYCDKARELFGEFANPG